MLLCDDSTTEDLFYCAPAWSKTWLLFCQQFLSHSLESVENNLRHGLTGMADEADCTIVLTSLEPGCLSNFFSKGMTSDCVHSFSKTFVFHIFWHIAVRTVAVVSPQFLSSSQKMLSMPGDFPAFRRCTASTVSSLTTGRLSASRVGV